jgi:hypothetical protein
LRAKERVHARLVNIPNIEKSVMPITLMQAIGRVFPAFARSMPATIAEMPYE